MNAVAKTMTPFVWGMLILLSVLWGATFLYVEIALEELPPFSIVFLRVSIGALGLYVFMLFRGLRMPGGARLWTSFLIMGLINNFLPFSLIFWGQTEIGAGLAAILNATTPLWTVLVAHFFTGDERMSVNRMIGALIGFAGVAVLIGPELLGEFGVGIWGQVAVLLAALSYAFAGVFGRRFHDVPPVCTAAGQLTAATILMLPVVLIYDRPWTLEMPGQVTWAAVLALALLSSSLAYILYFQILKLAGATNLLLTTFLIPVSAVLLGYLVLGETLALRQFAGMVLIGFGLIAIDGRLLDAMRRRRANPTG
ncbi:MAG: DMT family transporter [Fimbriimonadaceae bacterium]|nr:DMT family transporter [Alphaproteobacteria bacterium]